MATRRKKLSSTTKLFIVIAIALAIIIISGGMPEAAQFFKPSEKVGVALPKAPPTKVPTPITLPQTYTLPSNTQEITFANIPSLESFSAKISFTPAKTSQPPISEVKMIDSCQAITAPGNYILKNDMSGVNSSTNCSFYTNDFGEEGVCLCILSSAVNLDCQGFSLTNNNRGGAIMSVGLNNTIKNCKVSSYSGGLLAVGQQIKIDSNEVTNPRLWGILVAGDGRIPNSKITVSNNKVAGHSGGLYPEGIKVTNVDTTGQASNIEISKNELRDMYGGIIAMNANNLKILANVLDKLDSEGILLYSWIDTVEVSFNKITNHQSIGIEVGGGQGSISKPYILNNELSNIKGSAIGTLAAYNGRIANNSVTKANRGISLSGFLQSEISGNSIFDTEVGLLLGAGSSSNNVNQNIINTCSQAGIYVGDVTDNLLKSNNISSCNEGIFLDSYSYRTTLNANNVCGNQQDIFCNNPPSYSGDGNIASTVSNCPNLTNTQACMILPVEPQPRV